MGAVRASYGGIGLEADAGVTLTLGYGASPSMCAVTMKANALLASVPTSGSLVMTDGINTVTLLMWADAIEERKTTDGGRQITVQLKDGRWRWKYGSVTGKWNQPDKEGLPHNERDVTGLFADIGATGLTATGLPALYPAVNWEMTPKAQAIQELCDMCGLVVAPQSDGTFDVVELGSGAALPGGAHVETVTEKTATETPAAIYFKGSRKVVEADLTEFEAVGVETAANDSEVKPIDSLSYAPVGGWGPAYQLCMGEWNLGDEEKNKLAKDCIFKWYRWAPASNRDKRLPWLDMRAAPKPVYEEGDSIEQRADPAVRVKYTELDSVSPQVKDHSGFTPVTDGWSLDREKGIIKFNGEKVQRGNPGDPFYNVILSAEIQMTIAYELKNNAWSDFYTFVFVPLWDSNCDPVVENMPELVMYTREGEPTGYNETELNDYCSSIAEYVASKYSSGLTGEEKRYIGIVAQNCDGAISSVSWSVSKSGAFTTIQRGRDKPPGTMPTYREYMVRMKQATRTRASGSATSDLGRQVAETRAGAATRVADGKQAQVPGRQRGILRVRNVALTDAPAGGMAEVVGWETATNTVTVTRPTENNAKNVVILKSEIKVEEYGLASEAGTDYVAHDGNTPVTGDKIGTVAGQWEGEVSSAGSHVVRVFDDAAGKAYAAPAGGGGGGVHFCKIVSGVLYKCDPSSPATLTAFEKDMTEVREGVTGLTLAAANYPDLTFIVVFEDSGGTYFVHPFAVWRPYTI